jgi:hypothetical protein
MITLILTDSEAMKLRKLLGEQCTDPTLARIYTKLDALMKRPAVKRKYLPEDPPPNPFMWDPPDD